MFAFSGLKKIRLFFAGSVFYIIFEKWLGLQNYETCILKQSKEIERWQNLLGFANIQTLYVP